MRLQSRIDLVDSWYYISLRIGRGERNILDSNKDKRFSNLHAPSY